jgi:hypothetical protein|tara:strand:- start:47 stop:562 length:516 start_codon:yes stop_codon:yes gene_type:complete
MNIKLHARRIDTKMRVAIYAMTEFAMSTLIPSTRLRNNLTINIHLKHHVEGGEAMLSEFTNPKKPREFKVIVDQYKAEVDNYDRTRTNNEWAHDILKTLAHELVHVKQYVMGELKPSNNGMVWKKTVYAPDTLLDYFQTPYEIEAYGREKGLLLGFLVRWEEIEKKMDMKI